MQAELATWRPLWEFAAVLFVLGIAGSLSSRDRTSWWISQGLLLLSVFIGVTAAQVTHTGVDLFSLGIWVPIAWALTALARRPSRLSNP
jgi:NADH:ubiquinone oxidoreductase subunit K